MARTNRNKREQSLLENGKQSVLQVIFSRTMLVMVLIVLQFAYIVARMYAFVEHLPILLGGELLIVATIMIVILNTRDNPMIKLSWCFLVGIFPIFGSIVYLVIRYDLGYRLIRKRISETQKLSREHAKKSQRIFDEVQKEDPQTYHMAMYLNHYGGSNIYKNTQTTYFPIGEKMYEEMLKQLEQAKEYIFLEYFMIARGKMWNSVLEILKKKAKEGVDVRILYDGSCSVYLLPYKYPQTIEKLGIRCRMFSAPIPFLSTHYNNRDHRKIMVIDGRVAFTGGINLCDEYINVNSPCGHWKDIGVMMQGDCVRDYIIMFLQMWVATEPKAAKKIVFPDVAKYLPKENTELPEKGQGYVIPYGDSPIDDENVGEMVYIDMLNQAKKYVYIMTPYLILDQEMMIAITFAAKRGVDVRIILPGIPDKKYAFVLARSNYHQLLDAGVKVYEYTPGFVHAKLFVCDDSRAVVGSINLDYRSLYWHYECGAYFYKVPAIEDMKEDFLETQKQCTKVNRDTVKKIKWYNKLAAFLLKTVAPLM